LYVEVLFKTTRRKVKSDDSALIPISDEQAKLGQEIIKAFSGLGSFFEKALGSVPEDLIGYLGGDWLRIRRAENIAKTMNKTKERLEAWGVKDQKPASLTVALPILRNAADESREELQDLWARLLAATIDPSRAGSVRQRFAEAIEKMDPPDALVLVNHAGLQSSTWQSKISEIGISPDQFEVSVVNLTNLNILETKIVERYSLVLSPFGREFLRVVSD
jgi:hypothetical protein